MIVTELYNGQGLGNQLWSYVVTRTLAMDHGRSFGIIGREKFKGHDFLALDFGEPVFGGKSPEGGPPEALPQGIEHYYVEKDVWYERFNCDIRDYDPGLHAIPDNTKIEGYFQAEKFISHRRADIRHWLTVNPEHDCYDFSQDDLCILNVRGGEYRGSPELILPRKYWTDAAANMRKLNPAMRFMVITDDVKYARRLLPEFPVHHFSIGKDYSIIKNARYLVLSNSSFAFFPAWTSETVRQVIAPKYWARHNVSDGFWACSFNIYSGWLWQDRNGGLSTAEQCIAEHQEYWVRNRLDLLRGRPLAPTPSFIRRHLSALRHRLSTMKRKYF